MLVFRLAPTSAQDTLLLDCRYLFHEVIHPAYFQGSIFPPLLFSGVWTVTHHRTPGLTAAYGNMQPQNIAKRTIKASGITNPGYLDRSLSMSISSSRTISWAQESTTRNLAVGPYWHVVPGACKHNAGRLRLATSL